MSNHSEGRWGRRGRRRGFRCGRPRVQPFIPSDFSKIGRETELILTPSELEALKLIDEQNLTQEETVKVM